MDNSRDSKGRYFTNKPARYHSALDQSFDDWALECGWDPEILKRASEEAIRSRHHDALIMHESHNERGNQPDIFTLSLRPLEIIYTVESTEVVIRGYGWHADHEPLDDFDGGGFYCEASWTDKPGGLARNPEEAKEAKAPAIPQEFIDAVRDVLDYLWYDEHRHYKQYGAGNQDIHVFKSLRRIKAWLDRCPSTPIR